MPHVKAEEKHKQRQKNIFKYILVRFAETCLQK